MKRNCILDNFTFQNAKDWVFNSSPVAQQLHSKLCFSPFWQHRNDYTHTACNFEEQNIPFAPIFRHIWTRCAFIDSLILLSLWQINPSMSASECQCCSHWALSWNLVGSISCAWCRHERDAEYAAVLPYQQYTVCRQYMTCILCGCCLSQFQICVCVSRLVRRMPVSKFSLWQSVSTVTKSLSSPEGASCQFANSCVFIYWTATRILQWTCTETQQRF